MNSRKVLIALLPFACLPVTALATHAPSSGNAKTVKIFNNSQETIYPVVEVARQQPGVDHPWDYRVFIGEQAKKIGLAPHQNFTFTLPTSGWWNGGRVYVYDQPPPEPSSKNIVGHTKLGLPIYVDKAGAGLPLDDPYQLVEYTFTSNLVDYDISYVDHIYLPIAVEVNNGSVGYSGTDMAISTFQSMVSDFIAKEHWPYYRLPDNNAHKKIPGGYNLFAQDQAPSTYYPGYPMLVGKRVRAKNSKWGETVALQNVVSKWQAWLQQSTICTHDSNSSFCQAFQANVKTVWNAFRENPTDTQNVEHIMGYVSYGNWGGINAATADEVIGLEEGVPYSKTDQYAKIKYPYYSSKYNLNPYVTFVHRYLKLNAYAFSIDDAIGNVNIPGNGFTIAVGGLNGIRHKTRYIPLSFYKFHLNLAPGWTQATVCGKQYTLNPRKIVVEPITKEQCQISLRHHGKTLLQFEADQTSSTTGRILNCVGAQCQQINIDYNSNNGSLNVDVPPPANVSPQPPITGQSLSIYTGEQPVYNEEGVLQVDANSHGVITQIKNGVDYILESKGEGEPTITCTVTLINKTITAHSNCRDGHGFAAFAVSGKKDMDGFVVNAP